MSKCDRCGLKRKTQNTTELKNVLTGYPEMQNKNLCQACKNHALHVSACNCLKTPVVRPDWQFITDKRYKHDITQIKSKP